MIYMGSKNRIAKHILPIILKDRKEGQWYVEPFVGGGNIIDKVDGNRIGVDYSNHVINALIGIRDFKNLLPESVSEEFYLNIKNTDPDPISSWVRFVCSFGSKFEGGYARRKNSNDSTFAKPAVSNAKKQSTNLKNVKLISSSYDCFEIPDNSIIYCDPPYKGTTGYKNAFDYEKFYSWCRSMKLLGHSVFVSEYEMPEDFICVWSGEIKTNFSSTRKKATHNAVEKLFTL